jgi:hypothetical protein
MVHNLFPYTGEDAVLTPSPYLVALRPQSFARVGKQARKVGRRKLSFGLRSVTTFAGTSW